MVYNVVYVIIYLFSMFYVNNFMAALLGEIKTSKRRNAVSLLLYSVVIITLYFLFNIPLINMVGNIVMFFVVSLNYNGSILKKILCSVFIYIFMVMVELVIVVATGYIGFSAFEEGSYSKPLGLVVMALILYTASFIMRKVRILISDGNVNKEEWVAITFIPLASMYITIVMLSDGNLNKTAVIMTIFLILVINVIVFKLYDNLAIAYKNKIASIVFEHEKEYYYNQCNYMKSSAENVRSFRHDIKNHLLIIANMLDNDESEAAKDYICTLVGIVGSGLGSSKQFSDTGNIAIDSVINYKLNEAADAGIKIESEISVPSNLILEPSDITVIIGNLLDNAINAVMKIPEYRRLINISIRYDRGRLFIMVKNPFDKKIKSMNGRLITENSDNVNHGYGLSNVERTLEKYDGVAEFDYSKNVFTVSAMLYVGMNSYDEVKCYN